MINKTRKLQVKMCLEVVMEHPLSEVGEVSMFVSKFPELSSYIFSIPIHRWTYIKADDEPIDFMNGPGPFHYEKYKKQLIDAMYEAISIIENE
jgi:hypothetical protein